MNYCFILYLQFFIVSGETAQISIVFEEVVEGFPQQITLKLGEILGSGKFGSVFLVTLENEDGKIQAQYAMKHALEARHSNSIKNEWMASQKLPRPIQCPGLLDVYGYGEVSGNLVGKVMLLEYIPLPDLAKSGYATAEISLVALLNIGLDLVKILERLFLAGMTHGDLKPENLLPPTKDRGIILIDFGHATFSNDLVDHDLVYGTKRYMSSRYQDMMISDPKDDLLSFIYLLALPRLRGFPWDEELKNIELAGPGSLAAMKDVLVEVRKFVKSKKDPENYSVLQKVFQDAIDKADSKGKQDSSGSSSSSGIRKSFDGVKALFRKSADSK